MRTKPYRTAIAVFDEIELLDVTGPLSVLSSAGRQWNFQPFKVELVGAAIGPVSTRSELVLQATQRFADYTGAECLIVPGGYGARRAADSEPFLTWLRDAALAADSVAAIGNGVWLLARAGLLDAEAVAASADVAGKLGELCPNLRVDSKTRTCVSGKWLTASASARSLDLACELVARYFGNKLASALSGALGVDWSGEIAALEFVPPIVR